MRQHLSGSYKCQCVRFAIGTVPRAASCSTLCLIGQAERLRKLIIRKDIHECHPTSFRMLTLSSLHTLGFTTGSAAFSHDTDFLLFSLLQPSNTSCFNVDTIPTCRDQPSIALSRDVHEPPRQAGGKAARHDHGSLEARGSGTA